ncbi:MAG: peptidase T [Flavisolibacter sp.]
MPVTTADTLSQYGSNYSFTVQERFLRYVKMDTQSDPLSNTYPSTDNQKDLSRILVAELLEMGIQDAHLDAFGYVYATIPSTSLKEVPVICFCAHVDTAPDASGRDVKPIVHRRYNGQDIVLPDDPVQIITQANHPYLKQKRGEDLITASGNTLLGADNKAGVAIIMDMAHYLTKNPSVRHGTLKILFTPDEEIGRGVDKVDMRKLNAHYGYTLDGGERGSYTDENFNADSIEVVIHGVITHPGYAKNKLVNALKIAGEIMAALPKTELSPETTEKRKGFIHPVRVNGISEKCTIDFIIRDFEMEGLKEKENKVRDIVKKIFENYPLATYEFHVVKQYRNMKQVMDLHHQVLENAREAMHRAGVSFEKKYARGGTDGARLSFMGLPCPDIFTGEMAFHSKQEYISVQDMEKSVQTIVHLSRIWEEKA